MVRDVKGMFDEIRETMNEKKEYDIEKKKLTLERRARKLARKQRRAEAKKKEGKPVVRKHENQLLTNPTRNFWENSANADDITEWLTEMNSKKEFTEDFLKQIESLKNDDDKKAKAKHWRKLAEDLFKSTHPGLFEDSNDDSKKED